MAYYVKKYVELPNIQKLWRRVGPVGHLNITLTSDM